jgi:hypothetical protein
MPKRQIVSGKKPSKSLTTDHITKPAVPELVQRDLIQVGMKMYIPFTYTLHPVVSKQADF